MDPFTLMAAGSMFVGGMSSLFGGEKQSDLYNQQAAQYRANAAILGKQAEAIEATVPLAYARAALSESKVRTEGKHVLAGQHNWYASSNLDPTFGSPLLHQVMTEGQVQADAEIIRASAAIEEADIMTRAASVRAQAMSASMSAGLADTKAGAALMAGYFGAGSAFLSGLSKFKGGPAGDRGFLPGGGRTILDSMPETL